MKHFVISSLAITCFAIVASFGITFIAGNIRELVLTLQRRRTLPNSGMFDFKGFGRVFQSMQRLRVTELYSLLYHNPNYAWLLSFISIPIVFLLLLVVGGAIGAF